MPTDTPVKVFVSYAHQDVEGTDTVTTLVQALEAAGFEVLWDGPYRDRAPTEGFITWMQQSIENASKVVAVCGPVYTARFEKRSAEVMGRGVRFEGAILTQDLYDDYLENRKLIPTLLDGAAEGCVPKLLRPWFCGIRVASESRRVISAIVGDQGGDATESLASEEQPEVPAMHLTLSDQARITRDRLSGPEVELFREGLRDDVRSRPELASLFVSNGVTAEPASLVELIDRCPPDLLLPLLRAAWSAGSTLADNGAMTDAIRDAAAATFLLIACRLVEEAARGLPSEGNLIEVPIDDEVLCGIVVTALFGGQVEFAHSSKSTHPSVRNCYRVGVEGETDQTVYDLERALYTELCSDLIAATAASRRTGPLDENEQDDLAAQIEGIRLTRRLSLTVIVYGVTSDHARNLGDDWGIPICIHKADCVDAGLLGSMREFCARVRRFWLDLHGQAKAGGKPDDDSTSGEATADGPKRPERRASAGDPVSFNFSGVSESQVSIAFGDRSSASAVGPVSTPGGGDVERHLDAIQGKVEEILEAIRALQEAKPKQELTSRAYAVLSESAKGAGADPGLIRSALRGIGEAAQTLKDGAAVARRCKEALEMLKDLLG